MASNKSLDALEATSKALNDIRESLKPLIVIIKNDDSSPKSRALAQTGIALTLGTLRFMGTRLCVGKASTNSQLRTELNDMRKLLVSLQKKKIEYKPPEKRKPEGQAADDDESRPAQPASKRRKQS